MTAHQTAEAARRQEERATCGNGGARGRSLHRSRSCQYYTPQSARTAMAASKACQVCGRTFAPYGGTHHACCKRCTARADRAVGGLRSLECKECGRKFTAASRAFRYCSDACRTEGGRRRIRGYMRRYAKDPAKHALMLARVRASKEARRAREGGPRRGHRNSVDGASGAKGKETSTCGLCGLPFAPYGHTWHAYCKQCTTNADREVARVRRVDCKECGKAFTAAHLTVRYCSDACSAAGKRRTDRESRRRHAADPKNRAINRARSRACYAANKGRK